MSRPKLTHMDHQVAARAEAAQASEAARRASHARFEATQGEPPCCVCGKAGPFGFGVFGDRPGSLHACSDPDHREIARQRATIRTGELS